MSVQATPTLLPFQIKLQTRILPNAHTPSSGPSQSFHMRGENPEGGAGGICSSFCGSQNPSGATLAAWTLLLTIPSLQAQWRAVSHFDRSLVAENMGPTLHNVQRVSHFPSLRFAYTSRHATKIYGAPSVCQEQEQAPWIQQQSRRT